MLFWGKNLKKQFFKLSLLGKNHEQQHSNVLFNSNGHAISSLGIKATYRATLYNLINVTIGKYGTITFI